MPSVCNKWTLCLHCLLYYRNYRICHFNAPWRWHWHWRRSLNLVLQALSLHISSMCTELSFNLKSPYRFRPLFLDCECCRVASLHPQPACISIKCQMPTNKMKMEGRKKKEMESENAHVRVYMGIAVARTNNKCCGTGKRWLKFKVTRRIILHFI